MKTAFYQGDLIYLRPLELPDAARVVTWLNDPDNWKTLAIARPVNRLREKEFIEGLYRSDTGTVLGIVINKGDRLIGTCGLHSISPVHRTAEFGIVIGDRRYQGLGFGTTATRLMLKYGFEELNLNRIELAVCADNERGIRAYRKAGFVLEGRARQALHRQGRYHDLLRFAVLRDEWNEAARPGLGEASLASLTN